MINSEEINVLSSTVSVSGRENLMKHKIEEIAKENNRITETDTFGNLIVRIASRYKTDFTVSVIVPTDTVGYFVTSIDVDGKIHVGSPSSDKEKFEYVNVMSSKGVRGAFIPVGNDPEIPDCYIDIGAKNKSEAELRVSVGDTFSVFNPAYVSGSSIFGSHVADITLIHTMLEIIRSDIEPKNNLCLIFSSQEKTGDRGAPCAVSLTSPDIAICLQKTDIRGNGAAITVKNGNIISDMRTVMKIENIANNEGIKTYRAVSDKASYPVNSVMGASNGTRVCGIGISVYNLNTQNEIVKTEDAEELKKLIFAVCKTDFS